MAEPASTLAPIHSHGRQHDRTHMFVTAALHSSDGSCPIHIRNMSLSGALIEGAVLPELDSNVTLRRGTLEVAGKIAWRVGRRAGVAFSGTVHIADWMSRNPNAHQDKVDEIIRGLRSGSTQPGPTGSTAGQSPLTSTIESELLALRTELAQLESGLLADVILVATHPEIQLLDVALQRVDRILKSLHRR